MWRFKKKWVFYNSILLIAIFLNIQQFLVEQWMRFTLRNDTIVVSFSTTPHRINSIGPTLQSLYKQNINIDHIYLSIPYVFKRQNLEYVIPDWLSIEKNVSILRTQDYGPATKLLGVLETTNLSNNTIIITVDDDIAYPNNLILQLAYQAKCNPDSAIGLAGVDPDWDAPDGLLNNMTPDAKVAILQGFAGIAYRRGFFDDSIFNISKAPRECINSDDLFLSFYLAKKNIARQVLNNKYLNKYDIDYYTEMGLNQSALHNLLPAPIDKHRACISFMRQQDPKVIF